MLSADQQAAISLAAEAERPLVERRRFREIHLEAEQAAQCVLDAYPETQGRTWEGRSRKAHEHRPELNDIHWRMIAAAIAKPERLAMSRTKMLAEIGSELGIAIPRHVLTNPLKRRPIAGTTDAYWFAYRLTQKLGVAGYTGLTRADTVSVETILKALAKRLLPPKDRTMCDIGTIEIDLERRRVTMLGHEFRLHPTNTGKLRIEGEDAKVPLDALLSLVSEAKRKGKQGRRAAIAAKR